MNESFDYSFFSIFPDIQLVSFSFCYSSSFPAEKLIIFKIVGT